MCRRSTTVVVAMTSRPAREIRSGFVPGPGQRVGLLAGSGALPALIAGALREHGHEPFVVRLAGEAGDELAAFDGVAFELEHTPRLIPVLREAKVTHLVLAGGVGRRPVWNRMRLSWPVVRALPAALMALRAGDDVLLRTITGILERSGITVLGAHQVMPDLLAPHGVMGKHRPKKGDQVTIRAAMDAAHAIGRLDIGQAAVAFGSRAVALEGIEGTDGLLERTRDLRDHGRIATSRRGVLAKCAKPNQDLRADMPAIGPRTVEMAHAAGLAGIAVEAEKALVLGYESTVETADRLGLFLVGQSEGEE